MLLLTLSAIFFWTKDFTKFNTHSNTVGKLMICIPWTRTGMLVSNISKRAFMTLGVKSLPWLIFQFFQSNIKVAFASPDSFSYHKFCLL